MVALYLVSFSLAFIMHLTSVYLVSLLLLFQDPASCYGLPEPGGAVGGKVSQNARRSVAPEPEEVVVSKRSVRVEGEGGSGIADNNHQSVSSLAYEEDDDQEDHEKKKRGNYLIQESLVSFLPFCPNGYQITIEPDQQEPRRKGKSSGGGILSSAEAGKYILCQQNGRAKIKVSSKHSEQEAGQLPPPHDDDTTAATTSATSATYWITKAEAMTPLQDQSLYAADSVDADADESQRTKELLDTNCLPRKCPSNQLMAINTKNHMDCSSFYICIMGHHFLLLCPQGHLFSEEYGVCVEAKYSSCQIKAACTNRL